MRRLITGLALTGVLILATVAPTFAGKPGIGNLYLDGQVVRTIVPPAASPHQGRDNFYVVQNGVGSQLGIAAVGPGDKGYHGGQWAFHTVTFNVTAYELKAESDVLAAETAGDVIVSRVAANDFKCPIRGR
jgi:hypothetical protein